MKYYEYEFHISKESDNECSIEVAADILTAELADSGFEAFEQTEDGIKAYIQIQQMDEAGIKQIVSEFPLPGFQFTYTYKEAAYANWNEQWEKEGFEPIIINDLLCVHDAAHTTLPETGEPLPETKYELVVSPKLAFGSGTHPTTRQLLEVLLTMDVRDLHVIDAGCGTGILGMLCALRGARKVSGYDIDEWSVENSRENAEYNHIDLKVWLGDATVLPEITLQQGKANLLIANINRNILLNDMESFVEALDPENGQLLLSGFYEDDIPYLVDKATQLGLTETKRITRDGWAVLCF